VRELRTKYETTIRLQALKIEKLEKLEQELAALKGKIKHEEYEQDQQARKRAKAKARGPKPLNRVIFDVNATIEPDAAATFEAMKKRYHPPGQLFPTHVAINGRDLYVRMEYTVRGGYRSDIRRALGKCLADAGATLVGEPNIVEVDRTQLPDREPSDSSKRQERTDPGWIS
jgi:hypothetical protein